MKKNRTMRIATLMLALTLITCCFVGSTFAKYTSTVSGNDTTRVAEWNITVQGNGDDSAVDISGSAATIEFDLFNTVNDTLDGAKETDVDDDESLIAPGTTGSFEMVINNNSEVSVEYALNYTLTIPTVTVDAEEVALPILFKVGDGAWSADIADVAASAATKLLTTEADDTKDSATITIDWKWDFQATGTEDEVALANKIDTAFGIAKPQVIVAVEITVEQVD